MSYGDRLRYLKLHSLKGRRVKGDLIQVYKILKNLDEVDKEILLMSNYGITRNQGDKLRKRYSKTNIRKYTFSNREVEEWNALPYDIKNSPTLNTFKNRIDKLPRLILVEKFYDYDKR